MIALQIGLIVFLGVLSVFLATVEASFNLLKRRRLTQVGFHDAEPRPLSKVPAPSRPCSPPR